MASKLEEQFLRQWQLLYPELKLDREVQLIPSRKFRFDFVHKPSKICIEINGGTWANGRHNRGSALLSEYEKINLVNLLGYQVFFLSNSQINEHWIHQIGSYILLKHRVI